MRILLVENSAEWQDSIRRGLPEYQVDLAGSYERALACLGEDPSYVLAIVDLHLNDTEEFNSLDSLGGDILRILRTRYPHIRRIALTGEPPSRVRQIFDDYDVDELLLKRHLTIAAVRKAVSMSISRTPSGLQPAVKARRSELLAGFGRWRDEWAQWRAGLARAVKRRISDAGVLLRQASPDDGRVLTQLEDLERDFDRECAELESQLSGIAREGDILPAEAELSRVRRHFDACRAGFQEPAAGGVAQP
jgi:CheY-like chemotaxis protein